MLATIIIAGLVLAALCGIIVYLVTHRKHGCAACTNSCAGCSASASCYSQNTNGDNVSEP